MKNTGQTLFELVLALGTAALVVAGLVVLSVTTVRNSTVSQDQAQANRYSQQVLEWVREERDKGWDAFAVRASSGGTIYCIPNVPTSWPTAGACSANNLISQTPFTRDIKLTLKTTTSTNDTVDVLVTVSWSEGGRTHATQATTILTKWR